VSSLQSLIPTKEKVRVLLVRKMSKKMYKKFTKSKKHLKIGEPPGTLKHSIKKELEPTSIQRIDYEKEDYQIEELNTIEANLKEIVKPKIRWIKISGLRDLEKIEKLGNLMEIHPLVLEDIVNTNQRPKYEDYKDYLFIVLDMIQWDDDGDEFIFEQISIIIGPNFIISVEEHNTDLFKPILERITTPKGRVRSLGTDYLAYTLVDVIIDHYFLTQELLETYIEEIEDNLVEKPEKEVLQTIYQVKRSVIDLQKAIWPMRDVINSFQREDSELVNDYLQIYLRDLYDHIYRINDSIQNYREIITGMLDLYLSSVSNKMNDIMKVLTIISTIFIPLSFLAGFYGMNFIYMPELASPIAYPLLISIMISTALLMIIYFRKRSWI
jgi:magnesium transporter